jgi:hypothetical protein
MADRNTPWTPEDVANRFVDAALTARRLPSANVQGYFNAWPTIVRCQWELLATEDRPVLRIPPSPKDIDDMLEVMRWVQWLEVEQRHLVWMRANRYGWRDICARFGMGRTSAWQLWHKCLELLSERLNQEQPSPRWQQR